MHPDTRNGIGKHVTGKCLKNITLFFFFLFRAHRAPLDACNIQRHGGGWRRSSQEGGGRDPRLLTQPDISPPTFARTRGRQSGPNPLCIFSFFSLQRKRRSRYPIEHTQGVCLTVSVNVRTTQSFSIGVKRGLGYSFFPPQPSFPAPNVFPLLLPFLPRDSRSRTHAFPIPQLFLTIAWRVPREPRVRSPVQMVSGSPSQCPNSLTLNSLRLTLKRFPPFGRISVLKFQIPFHKKTRSSC